MEKPISTIQLANAKLSVEETSDKKKPQIIALAPYNSHRIFRLKAKDVQEVESWVQKIQKVIKYANPALRKAYLLLGELQTNNTVHVALPLSDIFVTIYNKDITIWGKKEGKKIFEPSKFSLAQEKLNVIDTLPTAAIAKLDTNIIFIAICNIIFQIDIQLREIVDPKFTGHTQTINCLLVHENLLWSGSSDGTIRVWNIETGACNIILNESNTIPITTLRSVVFTVWSGSKDGLLNIWDSTNFKHKKQINKIHTGAVNASEILFGRIVWTASEDKICIWT